MKWRQIICLGLLTTSLSSVGTVSTQAATWHKGTPRALRGLYQSTAKPQNTTIAYSPIVEVRRKIVEIKVDNMPEIQLFGLKYHKTHGTYYFKGWFRGAFFDSHYKRHATFGLKKHGHHVIRFDTHLQSVGYFPGNYRQIKRPHVISHH